MKDMKSFDSWRVAAAMALVAALAFIAAGTAFGGGDEAMEWTLEKARNQWDPMTKAVQHVGVPGYQYQAGVLWDGSLFFGPFHGHNLSLLGNNQTHLCVGYGEKTRFIDRRGQGSKSIKRWLEGGRLPIPHIETRDGDLVWHETVFAHLLDRKLEDGMNPKPDDTLVVHARFRVKNTSQTTSTGHLWLYFGGIDRMRYGYHFSVDPELGKVIQHKFEAPYGVLENKIRYVIPEPKKGALRWHDEVAPPAGMKNPAKSVIEWEVPLAAGEEAELRLIMPYGLIDRDRAKKLVELDSSTLENEVKTFWEKLEDGPGEIITPDPFVNDYLEAIHGQMAQQVAYRPKEKIWMYKTSPNWYEMYWPCNAAKAMPAFYLAGLTHISGPVLQSFIDFQTDDPGPLGGGSEGFEKVHGFMGIFPAWSPNVLVLSHGTEMWTLASYYRITRDREWLGEGPGSPLQAMIDAFNWVATQRKRTKREEDGKKVAHWGLLPAAGAHDWLSGNTIFNDAWCIYGMTEIVRLLREIKHPRAEEMAKELNDYRKCLHDRYVEARDRADPVPLPDGSSLPYVPRMVQELDWTKPDWTITGYGPLRAGGLGALDPNDELVDQALAFLEAGRPTGGDVKQRQYLWRHYVETETHWPMYEVFLRRDDLPRFFEWLFNNLAAVVHHDFRVGCEARNGAPSCAPGDGERWQAIRKMFINERGGYDGSQQSLWLLQAIPRSWLKPNDRLSVKDMGTWFGGKVNLSINVAEDGNSVEVNVKLTKLAVKPTEIRMRLRSGDGRPLASAEINGAGTEVLEKDTIKLPTSTDAEYRIVGRFR